MKHSIYMEIMSLVYTGAIMRVARSRVLSSVILRASDELPNTSMTGRDRAFKLLWATEGLN